MITDLNSSFYPKGCHRVGTDALVCPPEHNQRKPPQAPPKEGMSPNGSQLDKASPPPPLRMERGVDSIICKQRGRFLEVKEASP